MQSSEKARFVEGSIKLVRHMGDELAIVNAARMSFDKHKDALDDKDIALLRSLVRNHHTSPLEHVVFTFLVHCPLFVRSQWHRHRTWSYNEISRRYTEVDLELYVPPALREQSESDRQASRESESLDQSACLAKIRAFHEQSLRLYQELLDAGVCREQARGVLPQNLMTTFWATVDLNNLLKFLELRDSPHAQWEIREYASAIKSLIRDDFPHIAAIQGW